MRIRRVLVANRGEIALRIVRAAKGLGLETVLAASAADRDSLAAREADRVVVLGPAPARASYLDAKLVVHAAKSTGCDALHPGYGFLSERAVARRALRGARASPSSAPASQSIEAVGDKLAARRLAKAAGVAMTPGSAKLASAEEAVAFAEDHRLSRGHQGLGGRRRARHGRRAGREIARAKASSAPPSRPRKPSATARSISNATSSARVTSKCR